MPTAHRENSEQQRCCTDAPVNTTAIQLGEGVFRNSNWHCTWTKRSVPHLHVEFKAMGACNSSKMMYQSTRKARRMHPFALGCAPAASSEYAPHFLPRRRKLPRYKPYVTVARQVVSLKRAVVAGTRRCTCSRHHVTL